MGRVLRYFPLKLKTFILDVQYDKRQWYYFLRNLSKKFIFYESRFKFVLFKLRSKRGFWST